MDASVSGQTHPHAPRYEVISRDVRERLVAPRAIELLDAAGCRALPPSHERIYDGVERQTQRDNDDLDDVSR